MVLTQEELNIFLYNQQPTDRYDLYLAPDYNTTANLADKKSSIT